MWILITSIPENRTNPWRITSKLDWKQIRIISKSITSINTRTAHRITLPFNHSQPHWQGRTKVRSSHRDPLPYLSCSLPTSSTPYKTKSTRSDLRTSLIKKSPISRVLLNVQSLWRIDKLRVILTHWRTQWSSSRLPLLRNQRSRM